MAYKSLAQSGADIADIERMGIKITPPQNVAASLSKDELTIFDEIIIEAPLLYWTPLKIRRAVVLARIMSATERELETFIRNSENDRDRFRDEDDKDSLPIELRIFLALEAKSSKLSRDLRIVYAGLLRDDGVDNRTPIEKRATEQLESQNAFASMVGGHGQLIDLLAS